MPHYKFLLMILLSFIVSSPVFADRVFRSSTDLASTLVVTDGNTVSRASLYTICVTLKTTEYVDIRYQAELTNDLPGTVGLGHQIIRSRAESEKRINKPGMENITQSTHHKILNGTAIDSEISTAGSYCYHLRAWAVSSWNGVFGNSIKVEKGYGEIIAIVKDK